MLPNKCMKWIRQPVALFAFAKNTPEQLTTYAGRQTLPPYLILRVTLTAMYFWKTYINFKNQATEMMDDTTCQVYRPSLRANAHRSRVPALISRSPEDFWNSNDSQPTVGSQLWFGGLIELIGGLLVMVGFQTRWAAFLTSGTMAVAYFQFHWKFQFGPEFFPIINRGELAVLNCFVFLFIACHGGVMWSFDKKE